MSAKCPIHHIQSEKKMNIEQKSFWEYGAAWDVLHTYRDNKSHYGEVLKDAWRWRRICRNITNKTP